MHHSCCRLHTVAALLLQLELLEQLAFLLDDVFVDLVLVGHLLEKDLVSRQLSSVLLVLAALFALQNTRLRGRTAGG